MNSNILLLFVVCTNYVSTMHMRHSHPVLQWPRPLYMKKYFHLLGMEMCMRTDELDMHGQPNTHTHTLIVHSAHKTAHTISLDYIPSFVRSIIERMWEKERKRDREKESEREREWERERLAKQHHRILRYSHIIPIKRVTGKSLSLSTAFISCIYTERDKSCLRPSHGHFNENRHSDDGTMCILQKFNASILLIVPSNDCFT